MDPEITAEDAATEQDETGFDEGFGAETSPTETPGTEATETTTTEAEETTAAPAAPEYVQLTKPELEELRARAALAEELKATHGARFDQVFGKLGGLERALQQGKKVEIEQSDIDALKDDFPPLAKALEKVRELQVVGQPLDEETLGTTIDRRVEQRLLTKAHPDWQQLRTTPEWGAYVQALPEAERDALNASWDADVIGSHFAKFKAQREAAKKPTTPAPPPPNPADARRGRMRAAVTPSGSGTAPATDPQEAFNEGFRTG
jgi:hypothetical protein